MLWLTIRTPKHQDFHGACLRNSPDGIQEREQCREESKPLTQHHFHHAKNKMAIKQTAPTPLSHQGHNDQKWDLHCKRRWQQCLPCPSHPLAICCYEASIGRRRELSRRRYRREAHELNLGSDNQPLLLVYTRRCDHGSIKVPIREVNEEIAPNESSSAPRRYRYLPTASMLSHSPRICVRSSTNKYHWPTESRYIIYLFDYSPAT